MNVANITTAYNLYEDNKKNKRYLNPNHDISHNQSPYSIVDTQPECVICFEIKTLPFICRQCHGCKICTQCFIKLYAEKPNVLCPCCNAENWPITNRQHQQILELTLKRHNNTRHNTRHNTQENDEDDDEDYRGNSVDTTTMCALGCVLGFIIIYFAITIILSYTVTN